MVIQIAILAMALAVAVLVAYLVPMLIQIRKTAEESERLIRRINEDLPVLLQEASETVRNLNALATNVREGAAQARVLGEAVGAVGETINHLHGAVRGGAGSLLTNVNGWMAGVRAVFQVLTKGSSARRADPGNGGGDGASGKEGGHG